MIKDNCLVLENVASDIKLTHEKGNVYTFEGTFTVFDIKNENGRFYRKDQFMPFIERLQPIIEKRKLLGELDHPNDFSVKLERASHMIEKLELDPSGTKIIGKIRLLDTEKGKNAKAIADAGVPLHISSRASGSVLENGDVRINQLYTYDLVADPGFKEAELRLVNESISTEQISEIRLLVENLNNNDFKNGKKLTLIKEEKGLKVFAIENITEQTKEEKEDTTKILEQDMSDFVKVEALKKWSADVINVMEKLTIKMDALEKNYNASIATNETKYELVNKEDVFQIVSEGNVVFEDADNEIVQDKLDELNGNSFSIELRKVKEEFNERFNIQEQYIDYLKGNIENIGNYAEVYLKESIEQVGIYAGEYLREQVELVGTYSGEYLKENIENVAKYSSVYLREQIANIGNYAEGHLQNSIKELETVTENKLIKENKKENEINNEIVVEHTSVEDYKNELQNKIKAIQEEAKKQNANSDKPEATVNEDNITTEPKENENPLFVFMPADRKVKWDKLSEGRKNEILELSKNYFIESQGQVEAFWYQYCDNLLVETLLPKTDTKVIADNVNRTTTDLSEYGIDVNSLIGAFK